MWCNITPCRQDVKFELISRCFAYGSLRVVFLWQNLIIFQISSNLSLSDDDQPNTMHNHANDPLEVYHKEAFNELV